MDALGVHVEACTNEASAAAMLGASIMYPVRGAVTWKSIVGTNVASDALSNLASPGVIGGALIVVGEDYGEGASVIQERTHAFALKSSLWLMDPRPNLPTIVRCVEQAFELSEASNTPVILELRIRACHVRGSFVAKDNRAGAVSTRTPLAEPAGFDYERLSHPPVTFGHEKSEDRGAPAGGAPLHRAGGAERALRRAAQRARPDRAGRALQHAGARAAAVRPGRRLRRHADPDPRAQRRAIRWLPEQIADFCRGKRSVLVVEEGQPDYIEQEIAALLRAERIDGELHGKDLLPMAGEYTAEVMLGGLMRWLDRDGAGDRGAAPTAPVRALLDGVRAVRQTAADSLGSALPARPPNFCTGCPERPVFAALKLVQREVGPMHISTDIGCHSLATFAPFSFGNSILGYGMSLASGAGVRSFQQRRPVAIMGDGGFWHNGLLSGVSSTLLNRGDGVLVIMKNGYTSATGTQDTLSTPASASRQLAEGRSATGDERTIESTLKGLGVTLAEDGAQLPRGRRARHAARGLHDDRAGLEGHRRRRRMPARAAAAHQADPRARPAGRAARGADQVRRRRRDLHRRPLLHPPVGLPDADRQALARPAQARPGRPCRVRLRRLRPVRRSGAGRSAVPVVLARRRGHQPRALGAPARSPAPRRDLDAAAGMTTQPTSILIAALGGEGGGVLVDWIVAAALRAGLPVQATSVPGVAQRTGATSYYIEFLDTPAAAGRDPVFALMPVPGCVDIVLASELLEAVRMIERGFVAPQRTLLVTANHRVLTTAEKMAMGNGRFDDERLLAAAHEAARVCLTLDLQAIAQRHRTVISAVLYGALAGSGRLPWSRDVDEAVIRAAGVGVDASLAGYAEAYEAASRPTDAVGVAPRGDLPAALGDIVQRGEQRLSDFQDAAYAARYRDRVDTLRAAAPSATVALEEASRQLALWMSYEDVIRVADLKTRRERFERVRAEAMAGEHDLLAIREHLSPGLAEVADIAPAAIGRALRRRIRRDQPVGARGQGMTLATTSVHGFLMLRVLALLRRWRPRSLRFVEEQAAIEAWLTALRAALPQHPAYAAVLAELPRLRKGYSDTFERGKANFDRIFDALVLPCTAPDDAAALRLRQAIDAALADPEAKALGRALPPTTEKPVHWQPRESTRTTTATHEP